MNVLRSIRGYFSRDSAEKNVKQLTPESNRSPTQQKLLHSEEDGNGNNLKVQNAQTDNNSNSKLDNDLIGHSAKQEYARSKGSYASHVDATPTEACTDVGSNKPESVTNRYDMSPNYILSHPFPAEEDKQIKSKNIINLSPSGDDMKNIGAADLNLSVHAQDGKLTPPVTDGSHTTKTKPKSSIPRPQTLKLSKEVKNSQDRSLISGTQNHNSKSWNATIVSRQHSQKVPPAGNGRFVKKKIPKETVKRPHNSWRLPREPVGHKRGDAKPAAERSLTRIPERTRIPLQPVTNHPLQPVTKQPLDKYRSYGDLQIEASQNTSIYNRYRSSYDPLCEDDGRDSATRSHQQSPTSQSHYSVHQQNSATALRKSPGRSVAGRRKATETVSNCLPQGSREPGYEDFMAGNARSVGNIVKMYERLKEPGRSPSYQDGYMDTADDMAEVNLNISSDEVSHTGTSIDDESSDDESFVSACSSVTQLNGINEDFERRNLDPHVKRELKTIKSSIEDINRSFGNLAKSVNNLTLIQNRSMKKTKGNSGKLDRLSRSHEDLLSEFRTTTEEADDRITRLSAWKFGQTTEV